MTGLDMAASLIVWLCLVLLAVTRSSRSALGWYRAASLTAVIVAASTGVAAWIAVGAVWLIAKVWLVPWILRRGLPAEHYGVATRGTPLLAVGAAAVLGVCWWALGAIGIDLGALGAAIWLAASRNDVWAQALLLLTAEIAAGLLALGSGAAHGPGVPEVFAAFEVVLLGVLITWLQHRGTRLHERPPTAEQLTDLRG